jgi:predicted HAD superfamily Cof-like phosphohydrolase
LQIKPNEYLFYGNIFFNLTYVKNMDKLDCLNQVAEFHTTFHHPIEKTPIIPDSKRCDLRVELIAEELKELQEAIKNNDLVEVADALCDIQYVLAGAVLEFGLGDKFKTLFDEVQRSNMSKACETIEEAEATVKHYEAKGFPCYHKKDGNRWLVFRTADNKTLKNINYSPANIKGILEN